MASRNIYPSDLLIEAGHTYTDTEAWLDLLVSTDGDSAVVSIHQLSMRWRWGCKRVRLFLRMLAQTNRADIYASRATGTTVSFLRPKSAKLKGALTNIEGKGKDTQKGKDNSLNNSDIQQNGAQIGAKRMTQLTAEELPLVPMESLIRMSGEGRYPDGTPLDDNERAFAGFCMWMRKNLEYVSNPKHLKQLTYDEFISIRFRYKYTSQELVEVLMSLENDREHRKKYSILYNTLLNWLKTRHGDRRDDTR